MKHRSALRALTLSLSVFAASALAWSPAANDALWARHVFDHRCAEVTFANASVTKQCAADGSVGAVQAPVDLHIAQRLSATPHWTRSAVGQNARGSTTVFSFEDFVVVEETTCPQCARVMGTTRMFRPARAPDAVLLAAQTAAGLPATPLLRTVQAWRDANPTEGLTTRVSTPVIPARTAAPVPAGPTAAPARPAGR